MDAAAVRVLERLPHLQTFSLTPDAAVAAGSPFLARLADGSLGAHLRSLRLVDLHADALRALTQGLAAGCLPGLTELDVEMDLAHLSDPAGEKERAWAGLPDALAERARLGLPPLAGVKGVTMLSEGLLRRL